MESPSQLFGGTEECSSTESGWTMYIESPMHHDDDGDDGHSDEEGDVDGCCGDDGDNNNNNNNNNNGNGAARDDHVGDDGDGDGDDDDTDDSMASDASSGPCHDSMYFGNDDSKAKYSSCPYKKKVMRNMGTKRGVEERKKSGLDKRGGSALVVPKSNINVATSTVPSSATKTRKPKWMSKGN